MALFFASTEFSSVVRFHQQYGSKRTSEDLVFVDAKSKADVIVALGLSDGSNYEVYLAVQ